MTSSKAAGTIRRGVVMKDAKFYKPGSDTAVVVNASNTSVVLEELVALANTSYGTRGVKRFTKDALAGRFDVDDGTLSKNDLPIDNPDNPPGPNFDPSIKKPASTAKGDEATKKKTEKFFEEFWSPFHKVVMQQRATGVGNAIPTRPKEGKEALKNAYKPIADLNTRIRWYGIETVNLGQASMIGQPPVLEFKDWATQWKWHDVALSADRLYPFQPSPMETQWHGMGEVEPVRIPLWALYNLERGCLDRISAWALHKLIYQVDFSKTRGTGKQQMQDLMDAQNQSDFLMLDSADNLVQLNDKQGMGTELELICVHALSACWGIPSVQIFGSQPGATTGSEINISEYEFAIIGEQNAYTYYLLPILLDWYGIDADHLIWHPDAYIPEEQRLQRQGMKAINQSLTKSPFGGGNSPLPSSKQIVPGVTNKNPEEHA